MPQLNLFDHPGSKDWAGHKEQWAGCERCELHEGRKPHGKKKPWTGKVVLGMGMLGATYLVIGKHPGQEEDKIGLPVQGPAGRRVFECLCGTAGIDYNQCFFSNILGCWPPDGKNVRVAWIEACKPRVNDLIRLVKPKLIISMSLPAAKFFSENGNAKMGHLASTHGSYSGIPVFYTTHPGEQDRQKTGQGREESRRKTIRDFTTLRGFCIELDLIERVIE